MRHESPSAEGELEPLRFRRGKAAPSLFMASMQTLLALAVIFGASHVFVDQLTVIGPWLGLPSSLVALLLSPIATELPETMNAIIWIRKGKHHLALGNISGSMMIQATVPTALGLFFTPWMFDRALALSAVLTCVAVMGLLLLIRRNALTPLRLALFGVLYPAFGIGLVILRAL
jgi:cation:H+ antiporter